MPFYVLKGDLVEMNVDAIVNAANVKLKMVEGVGRAIFHKAGDSELQSACNKIGFCNVGDCKVTPSFNMTNAKIIIHAVGPIYINGKHGEKKALVSAYKRCFEELDKYNYHSIAFPLLSGEFNYPLNEAYNVAYDCILDYLKTHKDNYVYLVMYKNFPATIDDGLQERLTSYITSNYSSKNERKDITKAINNLEFVETIRKFQKSTLTSDDELILRGNLSSKLFSKLVNDSSYIPSKNVVFSFGIAMKLNENELSSLLNSCGYALNKTNLLDLIVCFYIDSNLYDVYKINNALFNYNILPLGEKD
ncbi:MAG: macro domain-containing protein [Mollicutes bacterium]|nr:macro domain-containing protein [Mollicutes bacterium]